MTLKYYHNPIGFGWLCRDHKMIPCSDIDEIPIKLLLFKKKNSISVVYEENIFTHLGYQLIWEMKLTNTELLNLITEGNIHE